MNYPSLTNHPFLCYLLPFLYRTIYNYFAKAPLFCFFALPKGPLVCFRCCLQGCCMVRLTSGGSYGLLAMTPRKSAPNNMAQCSPLPPTSLTGDDWRGGSDAYPASSSCLERKRISVRSKMGKLSVNDRRTAYLAVRLSICTGIGEAIEGIVFTLTWSFASYVWCPPTK